MTRKPMPYSGNLNQELQIPVQPAPIVGLSSQITVMTRLHRPNPTKIIYENTGVVQNVAQLSNPSMNDSLNSEIGLGSIVSNNPVNVEDEEVSRARV